MSCMTIEERLKLRSKYRSGEGRMPGEGKDLRWLVRDFKVYFKKSKFVRWRPEDLGKQIKKVNVFFLKIDHYLGTFAKNKLLTPLEKPKHL